MCHDRCLRTRWRDVLACLRRHISSVSHFAEPPPRVCLRLVSHMLAARRSVYGNLFRLDHIYENASLWEFTLSISQSSQLSQNRSAYKMGYQTLAQVIKEDDAHGTPIGGTFLMFVCVAMRCDARSAVCCRVCHGTRGRRNEIKANRIMYKLNFGAASCTNTLLTHLRSTPEKPHTQYA